MTVAAQVLVFAGVAVVLLSAVGMLRARDLFTRLHLLSPVTTLGAPLIGAGLVLTNGWHLGSGAIVAVVVLLAVTGPVLQAATARLEANRRELTDEDLPS
ncbi:monovalent cation/H(+) antiporter subunit G [Amycolatopsis sp. FDAARGOS 1241]|uniref:cation:proton antiporter n=1 Tax=Amycolatopsis sp. FDAARGOS 1241 TaxID=2778070 RepID=UPI001952384A|nr:monovalent cation/H(+) antiporter subunit G [Amycolatopsis sp. FDAARGOS 1241]QRP49557.1 monovalent cation/H(+) antiporter subunit G [Amycolatopsis sp. FDAARGOS 1241]